MDIDISSTNADIDQPIRTIVTKRLRDVHTKQMEFRKKNTHQTLSLAQILSILCQYNMKWKRQRAKDARVWQQA